ncbi:MAG: vanadium-dependent haloperoxidase [Saprospiraceae bacterium]
MKIFRYLMLSSLLLFLTQCQKDDRGPSDDTNTYSSALAIDHMELIRELAKFHPGYSPPVVSRTFGYAGLTLYEALVHGMPEYKSLAGTLNDLTDLPLPESGYTYHWGQVANAAMGEVEKLYFPAAPANLKPQMTYISANYKTEYLSKSSDAIIKRSTEYGIAIANAIYEYSKTDGGHNSYLTNYPASYIVPTGFGYWVPTGPNLIPLQPTWGNKRTFVKDLVNTTQPINHTDYSIDKSSVFYKQALEVYTTVQHLTPEQLTIAKFWSDDPGLPGTPPGHSISITSQVLKNENSSLAVAAEAYAKVGFAVADAFISCWKCKYVFNLIRPVTYINQNIDPNWKTILSTPPFPEYTSGHSVQSGATARVLSELFGYNYSFIDYTHSKRTDIDGSGRSFRSFDEAAQEAAISRLYGGIHYREAIDLGVSQGYKVGDEVNALPFKK